MNPKNSKKSPIHENADANITCDFGDGDISRSRSFLSNTYRRERRPTHPEDGQSRGLLKFISTPGDGCEVWGYENVDILEKVHTKFCKFIFGVSKYSHNMQVYGELGRYPLSIKIKQRMVALVTFTFEYNLGIYIIILC